MVSLQYLTFLWVLTIINRQQQYFIFTWFSLSKQVFLKSSNKHILVYKSAFVINPWWQEWAIKVCIAGIVSHKRRIYALAMLRIQIYPGSLIGGTLRRTWEQNVSSIWMSWHMTIEINSIKKNTKHRWSLEADK